MPQAWRPRPARVKHYITNTIITTTTTTTIAITIAPTASGKAALARWRKGEHPAGRMGRWPADTSSVAADRIEYVLDVV